MKILHTSDIHLKRAQDERWDALMRILEVGTEEEIDLLIISGDLFDKDFNAELLRSELRAPFSGNSFKIIILPGNHDAGAYSDGYMFGTDVELITDSEKPLIYENLAIWGLPFEFIDSQGVYHKLFSLKEKFERYETNVLVFHGDLQDAVFSSSDSGEEGKREYMPVKLQFFTGLNLDYILAGHIHSRFSVWSPQRDTYFVYPGSPISISKKETGVRKVNLFHTGAPPKEYPLTTPYYEEISLRFDPLNDPTPIEKIHSSLAAIPSHAKICLKLEGFLDKKIINMSEEKFTHKVKATFGGLCYEIENNVRDVHIALEDDLFKKFSDRLEQQEHILEDDMEPIKELVINALLEVIK